MKNYFELKNFSFNIKELQNLYISNTNEWVMYGSGRDKSLHTKYTSLEDKTIQHILQNFIDKSIVENIKFFKTLANGKVDAHTDKRSVAINLPVFVDDKSYTVFYKDAIEVESPNVVLNDTIKKTKAKKFIKGKPSDKIFLKNALCLNTSVPHGVINDSTNDRIILSISFKEQFDNFEKIKKLYDTGNLTRTK